MRFAAFFSFLLDFGQTWHKLERGGICLQYKSEMSIILRVFLVFLVRHACFVSLDFGDKLQIGMVVYVAAQLSHSQLIDWRRGKKKCSGICWAGSMANRVKLFFRKREICILLQQLAKIAIYCSARFGLVRPSSVLCLRWLSECGRPFDKPVSPVLSRCVYGIYSTHS